MKTILVSPKGEERKVDGKVRPTVKPQVGVDQAIDYRNSKHKSVKVRFLSGDYREAVLIKASKGDADIVLTLAADDGAILNPGLKPEGADYPDFEESVSGGPKFSQLRLRDSSYVVLDGFKVANAWPTAIYILDSDHISVRAFDIDGSTYAVVAQGDQTSDLLIEKCHWFQDKKIWDQILFNDIHRDNDHKTPPFVHFDGAFLRGLAILGNVTVRDNHLEHVFNGVHLWGKTQVEKENGSEPALGTRNINVHVHDNFFDHVRDNAVEPEYYALNWWVHHNRIRNCHKYFSFTRTVGGYWYFFANVGWYTSRQGPPNEENNGGGVFKFGKVDDDEIDTRLPIYPVYVFHNSWHIRSSYSKKGRVRYFHHFNNAIEFAYDYALGQRQHNPTQPFFGKKPLDPPLPPEEAQGEHFTTEWGKLEISFESDVSNHRHFPHALVDWGYAIEGGIPATGTIGFEAARCGVFDLNRGRARSEKGISKKIKMPVGLAWPAPGGCEIGAYDMGRRYQGPEYRAWAEKAKK